MVLMSDPAGINEKVQAAFCQDPKTETHQRGSPIVGMENQLFRASSIKEVQH